VLSFSEVKVKEAIDRVRAGGMVIIADDEDRENEGDLVCAAQRVTPQIINFMATHGRGLICLTLAPEIADRLDLPLMSDGRSRDPNGTAFTVSIDATSEQGVTTGISAADRARTIKVAVDPDSRPSDLMRPGTSSRSGPGPAGSCAGSGRPRHRWTLPASRAWRRPA
jgi:3,4-dihydroxy 2-butanone 4-phosphate synthase / GTP cyclohydrolase II